MARPAAMWGQPWRRPEIIFDKKLLGERNAGNRHATFDEAGAGSTALKARAPVLDPTEGDPGGENPHPPGILYL